MNKTGNILVITGIVSLILYFIKRLILTIGIVYEIGGIIPFTIGIFATLSPILILIGIGLKLNKNASYYFVSVLLTCIIYFVGFIASIIFFWDLCKWTNMKIVYEHKTNKNEMIISRALGCGAVDSSPPVIRNFILIDYSPLLTILKNPDRLGLNEDTWIKVDASFNIWRDGYVNGSYISPENFAERMNSLNSTGQLTFPHKNVSVLDKQIEDIEAYPEIMPNWHLYSDNTYSDNFKMFILYEDNFMYLQTTDNNFTQIDDLELMKENPDVFLHSVFTDHNKISVFYTYKSLDSEDLKITRKIQYVVDKNGNIKKVTKKVYGEKIENK